MMEPTLSIDLGSETTRVLLAYEEKDKRNRVMKKEIHVRPQHMKTVGNKTDFLSLGNFFDRGTPYIGNGDLKRPKSTTLKLGVAWAIDAKDASLRECPLMDIFREIEAKGEHEVEYAKKRVKEACNILFADIAARAEAICTAHRIRIAFFVMSIPSNWCLEAEDYYRDLIREAFPLQLYEGADILFVREVEADAHYLFHDDHACRTVIRDRLDKYGQCKFLIVDFGGFSFVSNALIYHVEQNDDDGRLCYSQEGKAEGATGGSAHFSHLFRNACVQQAERKLGRPVDDVTIQNCEHEFDRRKLDGRINATSEQIFELPCNGTLVTLQFAATELRDMWEVAHAGPLKLFETMVKRLARKNSPGSCVVVSGGSARHDFLKEALRRACSGRISEANLVWTDDIEASNSDSRLTIGMACALEERISVLEYFERGGAWGFLKTNEVGEDMVWDRLPKLLWSKDFRKLEYRLSSDGFCSARLVGTPFGNITQSGDSLPENNYILLELDCIPAGDYIFTLQCEDSHPGQKSLSLTIFDQSPERNLLAEIKLPLIYDMGSNCVLCDASQEHIDAEWTRVRKILDDRAEERGIESLEDKSDVEEERDDDKQDPTFMASRSVSMNSVWEFDPADRRETRSSYKRPGAGVVNCGLVESVGRRKRRKRG